MAAIVTTQLTLNTAPSAGFEQPFEMLASCHERALRTLSLLERVADHVGQHGPDASVRQAASDICRYFDIAGPAHHEDEERHLFPALQARGNHRIGILVSRLQQDHRSMEQQWTGIRADLVSLSAGAVPPNWQQTCQRWRDYVLLYRCHIEEEEQVIYPAAESLFDDDRRYLMGAEMAARRGVGVSIRSTLGSYTA